ncbi:hypothetical protein L5515_003923 [Caenorhabditis briggsae]|uniref:Uncharacterized protein n=1 Tax=Caenorhabditis briggsae TaxID=6238 RepID=A0AAE9EM74_CAEBR|nr:hypothetical protein L5515_003923 [Caenorhabditis briggsae]
MDILNRRRLQKEWKRFDEEVEVEYKKTSEETNLIKIDVEPNAVEITLTRRGFWEHDVVNLSSFDVVCRVRATNSKLFSVNRIAFHLKPKEVFLLKVSRAPHEIRSHHLKIDVTKYTKSFNPASFLDYFVGPYAYKTFIIRYHGAPRYWSDALEMNDWMTGLPLDPNWQAGVKKTSKEKKSSLETSEASSANENMEEETEEVNTSHQAKMNDVNMLIMSNQVPDEVKKEEGQEFDSTDSSDFDETLENELANLNMS